MIILASVLLTFSAAAVAVWTTRHYMLQVEKRTGFELTGEYPGPPADAPFISVVVAAKDEEANIATCVRSMLAQDYPNFEMVVCNDRSADRTAKIVQELAAQDRRLRLINIDSLPDGWFGKNNAMQNGVAATTGQWVCMIDADCRFHSPRTLSTALQYAFDKRSDMLSVLPRLEMRTFWDYVIQPVCSGLMMIWFHPDRVNNPARPNAYANGAFMLMKRTTYQAIGTHQAVKQCLNEDMHMARIAKEKGLALRVVRGGRLYSVRMYTSFGQTIRGWGRIFFGTFGTLRRLAITMAVAVIMGLLPYLSAAMGLTMAAIGAEHEKLWLATGLVALTAAVLQLTVMYRFYKLVDGKPSLAWTYPLGCTMAIAALCISLSRLRKGAVVNWRGSICKAP